MKRSTPMRRTAWPQRLSTTVNQCAEVEQKQAHTHVQRALVAIKTIVPVAAKMAQIGESTTTVFPKEPPNRNRALLDMARGRECLLRIPGVCHGGTETTVAAHSNWACHGGKGMGRKASDAYTVFSCVSCHSWLDQGPAFKSVKQMAFMRAHADQVLEWRRIESDPSETPRMRNAARWALEKLNSTTELTP